MKINEVIINEGATWDKLKNGISTATNTVSNVYDKASSSKVSRYLGNKAASIGYSLTGREGLGKNLAVQQYFIKNFVGQVRANLEAARTSGVTPNIEALVNKLAKSQGWDLINNPYKVQLGTAINNVNTSNFSSSAVTKLGALLYQIASISETPDQAQPTQAQPTQAQPRQPFKPKGSVSRIR